MTTKYSIIEEMSEGEIDSYLTVALSAKTVTPDERKKLQPLVKFYAKKPHPFRACVKDNRKRFGPLTEKYCAVIKDLIEGTTMWRNQNKKSSLSQTTMNELFQLDIDDGFVTFLSELELSEIEDIIESDDEGEDVEFSDDANQFLAEMYFADEEAGNETPDDEGYIWKPVLREGTWLYSPGPGGQAQPKPITVIKTGKSDAEKMVISMSELKKNFEAGIIEHVTVPSSHADNVLENTGFIRKLRFTKDSEGRAVLEAAHDFKDAGVKEKALSGAIANTSAGILFDYIHKETGKKYRSVLQHVALTNRPWLTGMKPFGVQASDEKIEVFGFSEESNDSAPAEGGEEEMPEFDYKALGFSSVEEATTALSEAAAAKAETERLREENAGFLKAQRENDVKVLCSEWETEGKAPALVLEAKKFLLSEEASTQVNLSEDGKTETITVSDVVKRLVAAAPAVKLSEPPVGDKDLAGDPPADDDNKEVELSTDVKSRAAQLYFEGMSLEDATEKAIAESESTK